MKTRVRTLVLVFVSVLFSSQLAEAQFSQQGPELTGGGQSVALSADGNTAIVGGANTFIYTRNSSGVWAQQGGALNQSQSVSLSANGNIALVGTGSGALVYTRDSNGVWTQQGSVLTANDAVGNPGLGRSVALSADGSTAIVGGPYDNLNPSFSIGENTAGPTGAAWIYTLSDGVWTQRGSKLVGVGTPVGVPADQNEGWSVALSANGDTAIVGAPGPFVGWQVFTQIPGAVWVFTRSGSTWRQQGGNLAADKNLQLLGQSVALSDDGNTAIVGASVVNGQDGAALLYTRNNGAWTQSGSLVGTGAIGLASYQGSFQGWSVALSADGNTAIVGGIADNMFVGAVWVYFRSSGVWTQQGNKLVAQNTVGQGKQGSSVALSADGTTAIVGGSGGAWIWATGSSPVRVTITATTPIALGQRPRLTWSTTNAASCTTGGAWNGNESTSGSRSVFPPPAVGNYAYSLTCNGVAGGSTTGTAYVAVNAGSPITHIPPCNLACLERMLNTVGNRRLQIVPYGEVQSGKLGAILLTQSGTVDAVEIGPEDAAGVEQNITIVTVSPNSTVVLSGDFGDKIRIVKASVEPSKFVSRLRAGAFGTASWIRLAAGRGNPKIVGAAFRDGKLSGLLVAREITPSARRSSR
jgi:hypothetical protein